MFLCSKCHEVEDEIGCKGHLTRSHGVCEVCHTVTITVDCHYFKYWGYDKPVNCDD